MPCSFKEKLKLAYIKSDALHFSFLFWVFKVFNLWSIFKACCFSRLSDYMRYFSTGEQ